MKIFAKMHNFPPEFSIDATSKRREYSIILLHVHWKAAAEIRMRVDIPNAKINDQAIELPTSFMKESINSKNSTRPWITDYNTIKTHLVYCSPQPN